MRVLVALLPPTLCNTMSYSPPGSSAHRILQARILEWVAIPFSRDQTPVSHIAGRFFFLPSEPLIRIWLNTLKYLGFSRTASGGLASFTTLDHPTGHSHRWKPCLQLSNPVYRPRIWLIHMYNGFLRDTEFSWNVLYQYMCVCVCVCINIDR